MKMINKDAVLVEMERIERETNYEPFTDEVLGKRCVCKSLHSFIDTLEVKEVDLEKELIEWHKEHFKKDGTFIGMSGFYLRNSSQMDIAKHFFELGLKAQKGENAHDSR